MKWEPWEGCVPCGEGCRNCYYYGPHGKRFGQNAVTRTESFDWPVRRNEKGGYCQRGGITIPTCFATDFFLPQADEWRTEAWRMIRERQDLFFLILTKRIDRFPAMLPDDWGDGYENVSIGCTVEDQAAADARLPLYLSYPIRHRFIACTPLLGDIELSGYLGGVESLTAGGETAREARVCDYEWVLHIREQCVRAGVPFRFKDTGTFFRRDGAVQKINPFRQAGMARECAIDFPGTEEGAR